MPLAMGLKAERLPNAMDRRSGNARCLGHGTNGPMCAVSGVRRQSLTYHARHRLIRDGAGSPRAKFIVQAGQALLQVALAPFAPRLRTHVEPSGNPGVGFTV